MKMEPGERRPSGSSGGWIQGGAVDRSFHADAANALVTKRALRSAGCEAA